jgi:hypothetical protein
MGNAICATGANFRQTHMKTELVREITEVILTALDMVRISRFTNHESNCHASLQCRQWPALQNHSRLRS